MISDDVRTRIRRLFFAEHWKIGTIAAELGLHHDTVELAVEPRRFVKRGSARSALLLDPYRAFIEQTYPFGQRRGDRGGCYAAPLMP